MVYFTRKTSIKQKAMEDGEIMKLNGEILSNGQKGCLHLCSERKPADSDADKKTFDTDGDRKRAKKVM